MKIIKKQDSWSISSFVENKKYNFNKKEILTCLPETFIDEAVKSITGWNGYRPTPLIKLNKLSKKLKLKEIYYKDESKRLQMEKKI